MKNHYAIDEVKTACTYSIKNLSILDTRQNPGLTFIKNVEKSQAPKSIYPPTNSNLLSLSNFAQTPENNALVVPLPS